MYKNIIRFLCLSVALSLILGGCNPQRNISNNINSNQKISVYTSFYAMYDLTHKIGGDKINLTNLVPSGTEPHDWEPTPSDIVNIEKAAVLVYNGAGMEPWVDKVLNSINNKKFISVETSKGLNLLENTGEDEDMKYDPHTWLNPMNAKKQMETIKNALVSKDPSNKDYYEKNYTDNAKKLDDLDKKYRDTLSKFTKRDIVVAHQAFGYICNAYGLNQVAIEGLNAESEPSPTKMAEITKFAKANNIKYIFFEELISPKVAETIAREVGAKTEVLNPLEGLDEKGIQAGKEYFSVMNDNLSNLVKALQ